jgi:endonuclease/exonuclease/phosphatase family metal-dependent hydrolase
MRGVTYNIQHGAGGLEQVAAVLRDLAPDLVFLQEVDRGCRRSGGIDQAAWLATALGQHLAFAEALPFDGGSYGIALLSRTPLTAVRSVPLPHPSPRCDDGHGEPRILLMAETSELTVGCTHLGLSDEERPEKAAAIRRALEGRSVLLGGDFNEGPGQAVSRKWDGWLTDCFRETGAAEHPTAPSDRPAARIDFIFRSAAAPKPLHAFIGPSGASDHRPVIVDFAPSAPGPYDNGRS